MRPRARDSFADFLLDWEKACSQNITYGRPTLSKIDRYDLRFMYSMCVLNDLCGKQSKAPEHVKTSWAILRRALESTETGKRLEVFMPNEALSFESELTEESFDRHFS